MDGKNEYFVQVWNCWIVYKEQTRNGEGVTQRDWIVRFPKDHGHKLLKTQSIYYSVDSYGFHTALGWALRHKPARVKSKGLLETENVKTLSMRYIPEDEWHKVGL